ncbi:hypothetical protein HY091_02885 [Candidatus Kaiserbacteria bacterium]|nr:hypothetical protein [Candidatus Kaiserbacteria bacterium]
MLTLVVLACAAALAAGLGVKHLLAHIKSEHEITWIEYGIGATAIIVLLAPLVAFVGWHISKAEVLNYHEYWNGWELVAYRDDITCTEDGLCTHTYDCDPYEVYVSETCTDTDSEGNTSSHECGHWETRYRQCPYVDMETNYIVQTTLGDYTIAAHRFPDNPNRHRWRAYESIPHSVIEAAGTGIPQFWQQAKDRIDSGAPGPVTARRDYDNYILASDHTILKQYSSDIARYRKDNLLPPVSSSVHDFYLADKVHFVGYEPETGVDWQTTLARLNAALGMELQGDVEIVIVRNASVDADPDSYALALKAYWQDKGTFGKDTLSKNGIGIVVGTTDGSTVSWARAFTGMPLGNEQMVVALESGLKGVPLTPATLIGSITTTYTTVNDTRAQQSRVIVRSRHTGAIASVLWGDSDPSMRFLRISMGGDDKNGHGSGFLYLNSEIVPTESQQRWIAFIIFFLSCGVWWVAAMVGTTCWPGIRSRRD